MIIYQSKKEETVYAKLIESDEKYKTSLMEYTTGEKAGHTFNVTDSTLKRWWRKVDVETVYTTDETQDDTEHFTVKVVDEETGKSVEVEVNPAEFISGVDDNETTYDFNNQEKKYVPMPEAVREIYMLDKDPYPEVEEVVDMLVEWGATVKSYREWIKFDNNSRVLFRRNKRCPEKACIEIRMKENYTVEGYTTEYAPSNSALISTTPYKIIVRTIKDLEPLIKSLLVIIK